MLPASRLEAEVAPLMGRKRRGVRGLGTAASPPTPGVELDKMDLCNALRIRARAKRTRTFLVLVEHDLLYLIDPVYKAAFDARLRRAASKQTARDVDPRKKRGRPPDEIARSLVTLFRSRVESVLELKLGMSKRGGPLYKALTIYLAAAGKGKPDRHIAWSKPWLSDAERWALAGVPVKIVKTKTRIWNEQRERFEEVESHAVVPDKAAAPAGGVK